MEAPDHGKCVCVWRYPLWVSVLLRSSSLFFISLFSFNRSIKLYETMLEYKSHGENFRTHRCRCVQVEGYLGFWGFCRWMILKSSVSPEASQSKPPTIRWTNNIDSEGNKQESYLGINWIIVGSASVAQQLPIESCTEFLWNLRTISGHTTLQAPSSSENSCQKFKIVT